MESIPHAANGDNHVWARWLQLALTTPVVLWCGSQFYRGAWAAFRHHAADMNTLVAVGPGAAFLYSAAVTLAPGFFAARGVAPGQAVVGELLADLWRSAQLSFLGTDCGCGRADSSNHRSRGRLAPSQRSRRRVELPRLDRYRVSHGNS